MPFNIYIIKFQGYACMHELVCLCNWLYMFLCVWLCLTLITVLWGTDADECETEDFWVWGLLVSHNHPVRHSGTQQWPLIDSWPPTVSAPQTLFWDPLLLTIALTKFTSSLSDEHPPFFLPWKDFMSKHAVTWKLHVHVTACFEC